MAKYRRCFRGSRSNSHKHRRSLRERTMLEFRPPFFAGVALGGASIKRGVVDATGRPLLADAVDVETEAASGIDVALRNMESGVRQAVEQAKVAFEDIAAVGLGSPGTLDIPAGML